MTPGLSSLRRRKFKPRVLLTVQVVREDFQQREGRERMAMQQQWAHIIYGTHARPDPEKKSKGSYKEICTATVQLQNTGIRAKY